MRPRVPAGLHTAALQPYILREPTRLYRWLVGVARRAPWWSLSIVVHCAVVVSLWQLPYRIVSLAATPMPVAVNLIDAQRYLEQAQAEPLAPQEPETDEVIPDPDPPMPMIEVSYADLEPGIDVPPEPPVFDLSLELNGAPSVEPPVPTPVLLVELTAEAREFYAPRSVAGKAKAIGGRAGTTPRAESSVRAGLTWLARAQEPDGSWSCRRWGGSGAHDVGVTGLALLAFLGAGYTQERGPFRPTVRRALAWLRASQKPNGQFPWRSFYEQGIAAMAVTEAYALTASPQVARMAQRAIDYICGLQPDHGGFRYGGAVPRDEGDLSVTAWQLMALKSALSAGLDVPPEALEHGRQFLAATYRGDGRSAYLVGKKESAPGPTAIGLLCRVFLDGDDAEIRPAVAFLLDHVRGHGVGTGRDRLVGDLYFTYYATTAMFQIGGEAWAEWNRLFRVALVDAQARTYRDAKGRYLHGSWAPGAHQWGQRGGRVYTTAMALLSLEAYYRFLPVYRRQLYPTVPSPMRAAVTR